MTETKDVQPGQIYIDSDGQEWTVIGVHDQPSVVLRHDNIDLFGLLIGGLFFMGLGLLHSTPASKP